MRAAARARHPHAQATVGLQVTRKPRLLLRSGREEPAADDVIDHQVPVAADPRRRNRVVDVFVGQQRDGDERRRGFGANAGLYGGEHLSFVLGLRLGHAPARASSPRARNIGDRSRSARQALASTLNAWTGVEISPQ